MTNMRIFSWFLLTTVYIFAWSASGFTKGMGENDCEEGWYFDRNLPGCDRCDITCARAATEEPPRACLDFCGRETTTVTPGALSTSSPALSTADIIVIVLLSATMAVAAIVLFFIVKKVKIPESWRFWMKKPTVIPPIQETQGPREHDSLVEGENEGLAQQEDISLHGGNMV